MYLKLSRVMPGMWKMREKCRKSFEFMNKWLCFQILFRNRRIKSKFVSFVHFPKFQVLPHELITWIHEIDRVFNYLIMIFLFGGFILMVADFSVQKLIKFVLNAIIILLILNISLKNSNFLLQFSLFLFKIHKFRL